MSALKINDLVALTRSRDGKPQVLAMLEAYFDESGIHEGAAICVIAGYWGLASQWKWFEKKWRAVLQDSLFPLERFHAKNLVGRPRHEPMLEKLAEAIASYHLYPMCAGIIVENFYSFSEVQRRWMTGATLNTSGKLITSGAPTKPYFIPFQFCLRKITEYTKPGRKAHFFFGIDKPMARYASSLFKQIKNDRGYAAEWEAKGRLGDPAYPLARETPQLQAADLLVHLTYKHMLERHQANNWTVGPTDLLSTCLRNMRAQTDHVFQDKTCLQAMLDRSYAKFGNWDAKTG